MSMGLSPTFFVPVEESRIYKAGGWIEFNRVNGGSLPPVGCPIHVNKNINAILLTWQPVM